MSKEIEEKKEIINGEEQVKEEVKSQKKFNVFGLIINIIAFFALILFVCLVYFSHTNFNAVKDGGKPTGYKKVEEYVKNDRNVIVYDYTIYKIEIIKYAGVETYTLKPFFVDNY